MLGVSPSSRKPVPSSPTRAPVRFHISSGRSLPEDYVRWLTLSYGNRRCLITAVPAATDALIQLLRTTPDLAGVRVNDGPLLDKPTEAKIVVIGWLPDEGPTVEWASEPASLALADDRETFTMQNLVDVSSGGIVMKTVRDEADRILEAARAAIDADPTLGGAVTRASVATVSATPYQTDKGAEYTIIWSVRFDVL